MKTIFVVALLALTLILPGSASAASSGLFKVAASGKQSLTWNLSGTRGNCEIRRGVGSGSADLSFKSSKSALLSVTKSGGIIGSLPTTAKGSRSGSFSDSVENPCTGFEPAPALVADASGCGAVKTGVRLDFKTKGASTWIVGPASPLPLGVCPSYGDYLQSSDLSACGDDLAPHKRSWGISYGGVGMFGVKSSVSIKSLLKLKKGKKKTITARTKVDCRPTSSYSSPITLTGELKLSLTFKRAS